MCRLDPNTLLPISWSKSEGAWAYFNETSISGLPDALEPEGIIVDDDPLELLLGSYPAPTLAPTLARIWAGGGGS